MQKTLANLPRPLALLAAVAVFGGLSVGLVACSGTAGASVQPGQLLGTWVLEETFDSPEQPFVSFVQDRTWSASDGCNRVQGTWLLSGGSRFAATTGPQTLMACEGAQLPLAVSQATRVEMSEDTLTLYSSSESSDATGTVTTLVRSTDRTVGPQGLPIGYWVEAETPTAPFLSISADRSYSGNDGCNVLTGSWSPRDDGAINLAPGAMSLRACDGVDQWLSQAVQARVLAGVMTLQAADGTVLGQLTGR